MVGVGRIKGPLIAEGRQPLYFWEATSRPDLTEVVKRIGPWLCLVKRAEFERTLGVPLPPVVWPGSMSEELAWAGGFFDGEGSTYLEKHRSHRGYFAARLHVTQSSWCGVAPELLRFKSAIGNTGSISGASKDKRDGKPYRRWRAFAEKEVQLGVHVLLPFIGQVKRRQALDALDRLATAPATWQSSIWRSWRAILPPRARQVERANPAVQGTRQKRRRSSKSFQTMSGVRSRGRSGSEKQKATTLRPSLCDVSY